MKCKQKQGKQCNVVVFIYLFVCFCAYFLSGFYWVGDRLDSECIHFDCVVVFLGSLKVVNTDQGRGIPPVFTPCQTSPDNIENGTQYTVRERFAAAEKTSDYEQLGVQKLGGLCHTYPQKNDRRATLLQIGTTVRNHRVNFSLTRIRTLGKLNKAKENITNKNDYR